MHTKQHEFLDGARLWSQTQPQRLEISDALRLVLCTQSQSKTFRFVSLRVHSWFNLPA